MPSILNATTTTGLVSSADNSGSLQLQTNNGTTAVTIDTSQNVGIGTTSPSVRLDVSGTSRYTFNVANAYTLQTSLNSAGSAFATDYKNALSHIWQTSGTDRMQITSGGDLQFNSGYGSVATAYGCRAWVNFNGTGTVAIRSSGNVSSITDNGVGDYTVNFTNSMPDANYSVSTTSTIQAGVSNAGVVASVRNTSGTTPNQTTSGARIITIGVSSPAEADVCQINVAIFR